MSNANALMSGVSAGSAFIDMSSAFDQAQALRTRGDIAKRAGEQNARMAELQAEDAITRGEKTASRSDAATQKLIGAQRAALAAQGIFVDSGSGLDAQVEAGRIGAEDAATIRINAYREALGLKSKAANDRFSGEISKISGDQDSRNTLLSGGLRATGRLLDSGKFYSEYKKDIYKSPPESSDFNTSIEKIYPKNYGLSLGK
jgi:hypothetical protein